MIQDAIAKVTQGQSLTSEDATAVMDDIMDGRVTPAQFGSFVTALHLKGETVDEITAFASVMRSRAQPLETALQVVDTCGTGGDGIGTFNVSTAAALVVAGAGQPVAKHGNRAASSKCGSADVLTELGVKIDLAAIHVAECIERVGIAFMFAPVFHPSMRFASGPRREIAIRTVFNILGPLTNPARPKYQVLGVSDPRLIENMARALSRLGTVRGMVVHGTGGLDEIALSGPTDICEIKDGWTVHYRLRPEDVGLQGAPIETVIGDDAAANGAILLRVLEGERGPPRDIVVLNAGAALYITGMAETIAAGVQMAQASVDSGAARAKLAALVDVTNAFPAANEPAPLEDMYPPRFLWDID
jgi:anthranilate phosphoribosyltransferase